MNFMETFASKSWKMDAFNLKGSQHTTFQILSGLLIFVELYLSIMSAVESKIANVFSVMVAIYVTLSLFCYFGVKQIKSVEIIQSYASSMLLAAVSLGYLMASVSNGMSVSSFGYSFLILTQILCVDAFYGFLLLLSESEYTTKEKDLQLDDGLLNSLALDNWKSSLFRVSNVSMKIAAFAFLFLEFVLGAATMASAQVNPQLNF